MILTLLQARMAVATAAAALFPMAVYLMAEPQEFGPDQPGSTFAKIDPRVRAYTNGGGPIPVLILLSDQPQAEIYGRVEARHAARLAQAQEGTKRAAEASSTRTEDFIAVAEARDAVLLDIRREALAEIEEAIRPSQDTMQARLLAMGAQDLRGFSLWNMIAAHIPASAVNQLEEDSMVAQVSLVDGRVDGRLDESAAALAPAAGNNNINLDAIHVSAFWDGAPSITGAGQSAALLDSGVSNPAAFGNLMIPPQVFLTNARTSAAPGSSPNPQHTYAQCFDPNTNNPQDQLGHGTEVASVIASRQADYYGVAKGLGSLFNLKTGAAKNFPNCYQTNFLDVVDALNRARNTISSNSIFNFSTGSPATQAYDIQAQTLDRFADNFHLSIVTVAGEDFHGHPLGAQTIHSPGTAYNVITVGAWDVAPNNIARWSAKGKTLDGRKKPDLAAPGVNIKVAKIPAGETTADGTSLSAPFVTGTLALLSQMGITDPLQAKALLINSAERPQGQEWHDDSGWGYLNLQNLRNQVTNALSGGVSSQQTYSFYTGHGQTTTVFDLSATLAWNRHFPATAATAPTGFLNDLDLFAYAKDSGARSATSNSAVDNVEFVHVSVPGDVVLKVKQVGGWQGGSTSEGFALAVSLPGFHAAIGPQLYITCPDGPLDLTQPWTCKIANSGDLPVFNVSVTRNGAEPQSLGTIMPGQSAPATWNLPSTGGLQKIVAQSTSYDEQITGTGTFSPSSNNCQTITATPVVTTYINPPSTFSCPGPSCQIVNGTGSFTGSFQVQVAPGCGWTAVLGAGGPAGTPNLVTFTPAGGTGNATVTWTVQAYHYTYVFGGYNGPLIPTISVQLVNGKASATGAGFLNYPIP